MHRDLADAVAEFADLTAVRHVVDIATGTGLVLRAISARSPELTLTGVDVSPGMLTVAKGRLASASFIEADAARVPLADSCADLITCITGLHVIPDTAAALAEWRRLLRTGGRVVTATFAEDRNRTPSPAGRRYPSDHRPFDSSQRLTTTAADHGFAVLRCETWSAPDDRLLLAEWAPLDV